jgi:hypothetical protein
MFAEVYTSQNPEHWSWPQAMLFWFVIIGLAVAFAWMLGPKKEK